ncbi:MAG: hypothetical protein O7D94_05915, partial [Planctomycetota bacterium]|nr:hypothetical protein [Planctomycetota bacterium]
MALLVRCKCGKKLKVGEAHAGRKVICPNCKHAFRISPEKFRAAAANSSGSTQKPPPTPALSTNPQPPETESQPADPVELDIVPASLDGSTGALLTDLDVNASAGQALLGAPPRVVEVDAAVELGYAAGDPPAPRKRLSASDQIQSARRGYWVDALYSFAYPFWTVSNVVKLIIILGVASASVFLDLSGFPGFVRKIFLLGLVLQFIIYGWLAAVYLSVVQDTAAGLEDMPGIKMELGFIDDIFKPALKFFAATVLAYLPAALFVLFILAGASLPFILFPVSIVLGVFFWPMIILMFAFGAQETLVRVDLIIGTLLRTLLPYLATWLLLLIVGCMVMATTLAELLARFGLDVAFFDFSGTGLAVKVTVTIVETYLTIVAMRFIGLYYLHFKHRFTFR